MFELFKSWFRKDALDPITIMRANKQALILPIIHMYFADAPHINDLDTYEAIKALYRIIGANGGVKHVEIYMSFAKDTEWLHKFNYDGVVGKPSSQCFINAIWESLCDDRTIPLWDRCAKLTNLNVVPTPVRDFVLNKTWNLYYFMLSEEYAHLEQKYLADVRQYYNTSLSHF